jgi:hypothetical protein
VVLQFNFSFLETVLWTNVGGIAGIYFFAFLSGKVIDWWKRNFGKSRKNSTGAKEHSKKIFTRRKRRIVLIKQKYGLVGLAFITPLLLSIPVGVFLVIRYYRSSRNKFLYLIASNVLWSVIYTAFYMFWDELLLKKI